MNARTVTFVALTVSLVAMAVLTRLNPAPVAQAAPVAQVVDVASLDDLDLCNAWHRERTPELSTAVQARKILPGAEYVAALRGEPMVGMSPAAVVCALGVADNISQFHHAKGLVSHWTYQRPNARALVVRMDNGTVEAWTD